MKRPNIPALIGSAIACAAFVPQPSLAGGISLYEIATPDVGLASAGYSARAQDASTLFKNPAGMSRLAGSQFQGGLQLVYGNVEFSKDANNTSLFLQNSPDGGNAVGVLPGASFFYVHPVSDRFAVGFGTFSYFGLASQYEDNWVGRYYIQKGALLGMSLMPAASFKATDWLSLGVGLNAMYGYLGSDVAIRTGGAGDGRMSLKSEAWGFGANVGVLIEPAQGTRVGVTYLSPVKLDFKATPSFSNLGPLGGLPIFTAPPELQLGLTVPQSVMAGIYQQLCPKWAIMADIGWQNWHDFGKVDVNVDSATPASLTTSLNYQDTWHGAIGAQYNLNDQWQLMGGFAYDSSAVSDADRTLSTPMGEAWRFGVGAVWQVSKKVEVGAACEFLWAGDMPVVQSSAYRGQVAGAYKDASFTFFTLNMTWRF